MLFHALNGCLSKNYLITKSVCLSMGCLQGKISFKNLKRVAKELGENLTDEELQVRQS